LVAPEHRLGAERDLLHKLTLLIDCRDAQVRSAEIYTSGKIGHNSRVTSEKQNRVHRQAGIVDFLMGRERGETAVM
jgi:hypothetical protein